MIVAPLDFKLYEDKDPFHPCGESYQKILDCLRPEVVREWGPGQNTRMALAAGAEVFSTESEPQRLFAHHPKLVQCYVAAGNDAYPDPWVAAHLFFVNGERRADCIEAVRTGAPELHVLVLCDAQRRRYWPALSCYECVLADGHGAAVATADRHVFGWLQDVLLKDRLAKKYASWAEVPVN